MSIAAQIFSEQDWSEFYKDLLIKGLSDDYIESYCDYMLTQFDDEFDRQLYIFQFELDFEDNFSKITSANLESDYRTVFYFFFFLYHTKGSVGVDILAIDDGQRQKWLQELLENIIDSGDWGRNELYEYMETNSILYDILFSKETDEYVQEKTATEEDLKMIDELESIYNEKEELAQQHLGDNKYLQEYQQALHDWRDAVEQMHKRINYVDVEDEIFEPATRLLKGYALNARLDFDIESVQTSVLKINSWFNNNNSEKHQGKKSFLSWVNGAENED